MCAERFILLDTQVNEIEVDIESFDIDTLWELHLFVMECSKGKQDEKPIDDHAAAFPEV